jgi:2-methylisocitrate lyase-like PEP mutase family enzyme
MTPTERMPRIEAIRHALSDTRLEGLTIHPNDRAVLDAWARHELDLPQAIDRLHQLLDAQASILTPDERQSRALASFPCGWPSCSATAWYLIRRRSPRLAWR